MTPTKTCENCRFYDSACHRFPEAVDCAPSHWCGEWREKGARVIGTVQKVPTETIVSWVHLLGVVDGRPGLVKELQRLGMSPTPAYRRVAVLVRNGVICEGKRRDCPEWSEEDGRPDGPALWVPENAQAAPESPLGMGRPAKLTAPDLLGEMRRICPDEERAQSIRQVTNQLGVKVSTATVHRLVKELQATGQVSQSSRGFWAEEVPT